jgi:DNA damage-binding protein 1
MSGCCVRPLCLDSQNSSLISCRKANRIEIWEPTTEGLVMRHSKAIHGSVSMFAKMRPPNAVTDHLLIGTIRFRYFTVAWNPETQQLETMQSFEDLTEKYIEESNTQDRCLVDPTGNYFMIELYQGILSLGKIKHRLRRSKDGNEDYLERPEQVRITELKVRASTFLYTESNRPKIALLYEEARGKMRLSTYRIVDEKSQFSTFDPVRDRENDIGDLDMDANLLIPVPQGESEERRHVSRYASQAKAHLGGVIVVGETTMLYLDDESKASMVLGLTEAAAFVAWERYNDLNYLLADDYGKLHLLTIVVDGTLVLGMKIRKLTGTTSRATNLVYIGNGILFIASHSGDSQIVSINLDEDSQAIKVLQTMPNVAPILDFAVMDLGNREGDVQSNEFYSGQARLVTCSGAFEDGSLRSVRSGVGLEDIGVLADMEDIRDVFSLRSPASEVDDILVVSFPTESRVFTFDIDGQIEEVEQLRGLALNEYLLLVCNLPNGSFLQVTSSSVTILGQGPSYITSQWTPPEGQVITAASANSGHVLLSSNGTTLVSLDIESGLQCVASQPLSNSDQVACISVSPEIPNVGVVGFWKSGSLSVLRLTDLQIIQSEDLRRMNSASIPRDISLIQVLPRDHYDPTLFVAMEDGIVLTFSVDKSNYSLSGRKAIVLGTQQARLQNIPREDGLFNVFATCEHPSLIYGSEGSVVYSAVTAEDAVCVCSFNGDAYPRCIVVATSESLKISQIDTQRRTHVQTLSVGKTVRRITYSANEAAFAIGCIHRELVDGEEKITSSLELVEEVLLGNIGKPFVFDGKFGPELVECVVRAELPIGYGNETVGERFIVGTSYLDSEVATTNNQPNARGRILIFAVDSSKNLFIVHSRVLRGACRRVAVLDGKIVAALVKTVVIMKYVETTAVSAELTSLASYRTSTCPIDIDISGNIIAVADMMKSVSLLEYVPGKEGLDDQLNEIARHHEAFWSTAVLHLEENKYLETDMEGNIITLARNPEGVTLEDRKKLAVTSEINLGEMVNKIHKINVEPSPNAMVVPKAFLATVSLVRSSSSLYLANTLYRPKDQFTYSL